MQPPASPSGAAAALRGSVYGGQQPVAASAVYLYAATSGSTATPSVSLLKASSGTVANGKGSYYAPTDANGNFNLAPGGTPAYTCTGGQQLYVISVGGNAGLGTVGPQTDTIVFDKTNADHRTRLSSFSRH